MFAAVATLMSIGGVAAADTVRSTVTDYPWVVEVERGGAGVTVGFRITPTNEDGKKGCNPSTSNPATLTFSHLPSGVTASPSSLRFTRCDVTQTTTLRASFDATPDFHLIRVATSSAQGSYTTWTGWFFLLVSEGNATPSVTVTGVSEGATYEAGRAPAPGCLVGDPEDGSPTVLPVLSGLQGPLAALGLGARTATCSYTDAGGKSATASARYTISDAVAPDLTVPADRVVEATGPSGATVGWPAPSAQDGVDPSPSLQCSESSGRVFPLGNHTVTCNAQDAAGNRRSATFSVAVIDTTAPTLGAVGGMQVGATGPGGAAVSFGTPQASDTVDGSVPVTCSATPGSMFPIGSSRVTCTARDRAGNEAGSSFTITVADSDAPVLSSPANLVVEATSAAGASVSFALPSAHDAVEGVRPVTCSRGPGSQFPLGRSLVSCSAQDAHGHTGSSSFAVSVIDTTPPAITVPGDVVAEAASAAGAGVGYQQPVARDVVDGVVATTCDGAGDSTFPLGQTRVTCRAADAAGNGATATFTVNVRDTQAPRVEAPANVVAAATSLDGAVIDYEVPVADDSVDGQLGTSCDRAPGSLFPVGSTTVTCSAQDSAGNRGADSFTVLVTPPPSLPGGGSGGDEEGPGEGGSGGRDRVPPKLELPKDMTLRAERDGGIEATYEAAATDDVDGAVRAECSPSSGTVFPVGVTQVRCVAEDAAGNVGEGHFSVAVLYRWDGFEGTRRKVTAGRRQSIKFGLGGDQGLEVLAGRPTSHRVKCRSGVVRGPAKLAKGGLHYDGTSDSYEFNWKTPRRWAGTCRVFDLGLNDGTDHQLKLRIKRSRRAFRPASASSRRV